MLAVRELLNRPPQDPRVRPFHIPLDVARQALAQQLRAVLQVPAHALRQHVGLVIRGAERNQRNADN